jgi:hypothetical protein
MKTILILALVVLFGLQATSQPVTKEYLESLRYSHDLNLPEWGPYTKNYIGVSHIPDVKKGLRFDLSVFPGIYRRKVDVPSVTFESGYHPWEASPNLEYFSFRHELEWKDQVYTDISYSVIDGNSRLIRAEFVNNTSLPQSLVLHYMASVHFPSIKVYQPNTPVYPAKIELPQGTKWIDALDYIALGFAKPRPTDNLVADGKMRAEERLNGFVSGTAIGTGFGADKGDWVNYSVSVDHTFSDAVVWLRYKIDSDDQLEISLSGLVDKKVTLKGNGEISSVQVPVGKLNAGKYQVRLTSNGGTAILIDGFTIVESKDVQEIKTSTVNWNYVPKLEKGPVANSIILKYEQFDNYYGIYWNYPQTDIRQWFYNDLSDDFKHEVNEHVQKEFHNGSKDGHFTNVFFRPINCKPKSTQVIYGIVCSGTKEEVEARLRKAGETNDWEEYYINARKYIPQNQVNPDGEKYVFSQKRMEAVTACNVVYPVYTQKQYIRHRAPGRWWDCLYTWDSGFIGIGLLTDDVRSAVENLNAYVNEPDEQSAFIHHGTPLPVQHYLFLELWNKTQSREILSYFYPKLKRYYQFLAGGESSSTGKFKSGVLCTWDYFYNSGGWDDYPPQKYMHDHAMEQVVAPVVTSSHVIRIAKILRMAANELGLKDDEKLYEKDIARFAAALQKYSWDEPSGYFSYVLHDADKNPVGKLLYQDKVNLDMGFDGLSPLVAGITTKDQTSKLLAHLKTPGQIWSNVGLSAVDQTAPYYLNSGYWNGTVWMPHQWFFWKTMLDLGEGDFAFKIAKTGLEVWKQEVEASYNCMEHFVIETGRGAGWHEFGGLSTPVLSWFKTYFEPGNLTGGLNFWVEKKEFSENNSALVSEIKLFNDQSDTCSVVACMNPNYHYQVFWNGKLISCSELCKGSLLINLPANDKSGKLEIRKK